jgi:murein DD-endopeptidase MepM/ murein hydrolase activator NlpD
MNRLTLTIEVLIMLAVSTQASPQTSRHIPHTSSAAPSTAVKNVFWQPNQLQQGSDAFFTVEFERAPVRVSATWIGKTLSFFKTDNSKVWYALAGADLETQPGSYDLAITATLPGGRIARSTKPIDIAAANFLTGSVDVPENFVEPDAAGKKQIASDELAKAHAFAHLIPIPRWTGNFKPPVAAKSTPSFGESRILNEEKSSLHRGTDFPVNEGTPVEASNSGTVVLAKELFYEGNCIIIDHGQKFFTIYMHLSKINVAAGDKVAKGAHIGLSGATGRVTGPHLHMGVRWNGAYLDPVQLLALTLPPIPANEHGEHARPGHTRSRVRSRR